MQADAKRNALLLQRLAMARCSVDADYVYIEAWWQLGLSIGARKDAGEEKRCYCWLGLQQNVSLFYTSGVARESRVAKKIIENPNLVGNKFRE